MNILVFNWQDRHHPQSGGAETHLHEIFGRLVKRGHAITLVSCSFSGAKREEFVDGIRVIRIGNRSIYNVAAIVWWLRSGRQGAYDLVIDDINKIPLFTPLFVGKPILGIIHHLFGRSIFKEAGLLAGTYVGIAELLLPLVYRRTTIAVVSNSTREECIEAGMEPDHLNVIHNGVAFESFPMAVGHKAPQPMITYFGRLKRYKSVDHLIRAMKIVIEHFPTAQLSIVGRGDDEERLRAVCASLGLAGAVTFFGFVDEKQKIELLSMSHIVVNPSQKEGWGITNLEANACGTAVISADSPGLRDSVKNDVSGVLYPYGNVEALATSIIDLLHDAQRLSRLSHDAVDWARQFSWDQSAVQMEQLCHRILS